MDNAIINVNGQLQGPDQAKVSVFDRGYVYGDSIYEVCRSYGGKFFLLDDHLARLQRSAALCHIDLSHTVEHYKAEIYRTFAAFREKQSNPHVEAYCRLIVSRGVGSLGFGLSGLKTASQYVIIQQPVDEIPASRYQKGLNLKIATRLRNDRRALDPAMKSGNYLNSLLAFLESTRLNTGNGAPDDALLCNSEGHITEGTTFNIYYVKRGIVVTPPLEIGILSGITRHFVFELIQKLNLRLREVRFPPARLFDADEVFMTSSLKEVFPVTKIDGKKVASGTPGPITLSLLKAYRQHLHELQ